ncbi:hypothetical protein IGS73_09400 [Janibacter indicus]|uniref:Uncharacterized protein n=1 Tax=Janibacter indicus TaxID=857417 RepID=A0A7L9IVF4_9MICO|nr:DUF6214 family protein [Janibacter indicus]QOK21396.1 hypothetical protein IGS73_09400 [Janibacter indicus]
MTLPQDVLATAQPGWPHFPGVPQAWVQHGSVQLPSVFQLNVIDKATEATHATLMYAVEDGEVGLRVVISSPMEVPDMLDWLRERRPLRWWKRWAIVGMALDTAERSHAAELANAWLMSDSDGEAADREHTDRRAQVLAPVYAAALKAPVDRRRNRVTDEDLRAAASVYLAAKEQGQPPTVAVEETFNLSRSGAGRWIRMARDAGHLPPTTKGQR